VLRDDPKEVVAFENPDRPDRRGGPDFGGGGTEALGKGVTGAAGANDWMICGVCGENLSVSAPISPPVMAGLDPAIRAYAHAEATRNFVSAPSHARKGNLNGSKATAHT
jgi:hypothetical protein